MDWVQVISNYGFPIVVSLWLLIKTQHKLEEVNILLTKINENISNREDKRDRRSTRQAQ